MYIVCISDGKFEVLNVGNGVGSIEDKMVGFLVTGLNFLKVKNLDFL